jgi:hypothetical protein
MLATFGSLWKNCRKRAKPAQKDQRYSALCHGGAPCLFQSSACMSNTSSVNRPGRTSVDGGMTILFRERGLPLWLVYDNQPDEWERPPLFF